ncbi:MAG: SEL1-like repeat protein [Planctomycetes bacterium]|nr:SEL1-like repeat protein [Planctomycetota bacterium]
MRIGPYEVLEELARGGMGAVYRSRDPKTGREVAIKVLLRGGQATPRQRTRFDREAQALRKVDHANVVRLRDVGEDKGVPFLVLDYHREGSLEETLKRTTLSAFLTARIGAHMAAGLEAAHAHGVLHRDLKPANVLIGENGFAMLNDFGLAKDLNREDDTARLTQTGTLQGTPGFWAPEQAGGKLDEVGPATDVYGLGATLYAALCGRPPILADSFLGMLTATATEVPPGICAQRPEIPSELEAVIFRCLEKDPSARWANASELKRALSTCLRASQEELVSPKEADYRAPAVAVILVLLLLGLLAAVLFSGRFVWTSPPDSRPSNAPDVATSATTGAATPSATPPRLSSQADELYARARLARRDKHPQKYVSLLRRAADLGHAKAMSSLGTALAKGYGVGKDNAQAVKWFRRAIDLGDAEAMTCLGVMLAEGRGLPKDEALAAEWYRRAIEASNDTTAMVNLGMLLEAGHGVEKRQFAAAAWYSDAAKRGSLRGMNNMGKLLLKSDNPLDHAAAAPWFRRAAESGHTSSMISLGLLLEEGRGVATSHTKALGWYERAAKKDDPEGMNNLASMLERGLGTPVDLAKAVEWYRRASDHGHPESLYRLGQMLEKGLGADKDETMAAKAYSRAIDKGNRLALAPLGHLLASGRGVPKDPAEAARCYRLAAEGGEPVGMYWLGHALEHGLGLPKDSAGALKWYRRATKGESQEARDLAQAALDRLGQ